MAGPGDAVGAHHAFANRAQLLHRRLASLIALVDAELDPAHSAIEGALKHHVLDPPVEACAAQLRPVIGSANLEHAAIGVDAEIARHARQLIAVEQDEGAVSLTGPVVIDALVETLGPKIVGVELPDVLVLGARGPQPIAMPFLEQLR